MTSPSFTTSQNSALDALRESDAPLNVLHAWRKESVFSADEASRLWQQALNAADTRKTSGAYYTDADVARAVVRQSIAHIPKKPAHILEPSCGGGTLVVAALHEGVHAWTCDARELATRIHAWDLDPAGVFLAQWRVAEHFGEEVARAIHWHVGDALAPAPPGVPPTFDWTLGNPPFGNAIDRATRRSKEERAHYARLFPLAARGAFDKCALFIELAAQRSAPEGHITLILPRSWLAQPASTLLRKDLATRFDLREIAHLPDDAFFEASVSTIAITLAKRTHPYTHSEEISPTAKRSAAPSTLVRPIDGSPQELDAAPLLQRGNWGAALHPFAHILTRAAPALVELSKYADFSAGASTAEAYEWSPHVKDLVDAGASETETDTSKAGNVRDAKDDERALLIAGMIEPFHNDWGNKRTRYLGNFYARPVLSMHQLSERRQALHSRPRALLPTLSVALEAFPDLTGEFIGAVSTISAWPLPSKTTPNTLAEDTTHLQVLFLSAILNSAWCRLNYTCLYASLALQGGNTQVSKNKLASLQIPALWGELISTPSTLSVDAQPDANPIEHQDSTPVVALDTQIAAELKAFDLTPLDKKLPSMERMFELLDNARALAANHSKGALIAHLAAQLQTDAAAAMYSAQADIILLAISPDLLRHIPGPH